MSVLIIIVVVVVVVVVVVRSLKSGVNVQETGIKSKLKAIYDPEPVVIANQPKGKGGVDDVKPTGCCVIS